MASTAERRREATVEALERVRARMGSPSRGECEFTEDDADVRLLLRRLERVRKGSGCFRAASVSLSPYMESLLQLDRSC